MHVNTRRWHRVLAMGVLSAIASVAPGSAEAQSTRAYQGLFAQRERQTKRQPVIDFTMAVSDAYDSGNDPESVGSRPNGSYSNLDSAFRLVHVRKDRHITVSASSGLRYEPQFENLLSSYDASVGYINRPWHSGQITLDQGFAYTPYYQLELFPMLPIDAAQPPQANSVDYAVSRLSSYAVTTGAGFTQNLGRRAALIYAYDRRSVTFDQAGRDFLTQNQSIRFTRRARRRGGFHTGLATHRATYGLAIGGSTLQTYDLDFGFDYTTRRTSVTASYGGTFIPIGRSMTYRTTGNASARLMLSRKWSMNANYTRALRFVEALAYPYFADSFAAGLRAQAARRVSLGTAVGYSTGQVGLSAEAGAYGTYSAGGDFSVSLSRHYAVYTEYLYYHYDFSERAFVGRFPPQANRNTVRIGLRLWLPLAN
jgi:hypothetical protein